MRGRAQPQTNPQPLSAPNGRIDLVQSSSAQATGAGRTRTALAVLAVLGATVIFGVGWARQGAGGKSVLAAAHALRSGDTIGASDVTDVVVRVTGGGVATIPSAQRSSVLGQHVTGPMTAGTLLAPSSVSPGSQLAPGELGLALALDPDRAAQGLLAAGQAVLIVGLQPSAAGQQPTPLAAPARVISVLPPSGTSGKVIVDLALAAATDAGPVAATVGSSSGVRLVVVAPGVSH